MDITRQYVHSHLYEHEQEFIKNFEQLYQIKLLKDLLDLILTKAKQKKAKFVIKISRIWNRAAGDCQTEGIVERIGGKILRRKYYTITIRNISHEVIMHEIAHAVEKESAINLNGEFRKAIANDMQEIEFASASVKTAIKQIMIEEMKAYKASQVMEEMFARYFELLAMSYDVGGWGRYQFYAKDIIKFFENTTRWVESSFNPMIKHLSDKEIVTASDKFVANLKPYQMEWVKKIGSIHNNTPRNGAIGDKKWTGNMGSNNDWLASYQKHANEQITNTS